MESGMLFPVDNNVVTWWHRFLNNPCYRVSTTVRNLVNEEGVTLPNDRKPITLYWDYYQSS